MQHLPSPRRAGPRAGARRACSARRVTLQSGETVVVDEAYVRESILNRRAKVTAGFQPIMPTFQGLVSEEQLLAADRVRQVAEGAAPGADAIAMATRLFFRRATT